MLGILLIYFVGKSFYKLAELHSKNKWLMAILGVVSYYAGTFLGGVIIAIVYELNNSSSEEMNDVLGTFLALPVGVLACWGFYKILKKQWEGNVSQSDSLILDDEFVDE